MWRRWSAAPCAPSTINPEDVGLARVKPEALRGGDAKDNAQALLDVLKGKKGPYRDVAHPQCRRRPGRGGARQGS